jgi:hypothetical protein
MKTLLPVEATEERLRQLETVRDDLLQTVQQYRRCVKRQAWALAQEREARVRVETLARRYWEALPRIVRLLLREGPYKPFWGEEEG